MQKNFLLDRTIHINLLNLFDIDLLVILSSSILFFYFSTLVVTSIGFFVGVPIKPFHFWLSLGLSIFNLAFWIIASRRKTKFLILYVLFFLFVLFSTVIFTGNFFDFSWDGQWYHQSAIVELHDGWNPYHKEINHRNDVYTSTLVNHFPKATWIASTVLFSATKNLETGKAINFLMIFCLFFFSYKTLQNLELNNFSIFLASLLIAANPVSIYQSLSFYLDGQVASLFSLVVILFLYLFLNKKKKDINFILFNLFMAVAIGINIKFTSLVYLAIFSSILSIFYYFEKKSKKVVLVLFLSIFYGTFVLGFQPYTLNLLKNGNIFYPLYGSNDTNLNRVRTITGQMPINFIGQDRFYKLFQSLLSESKNKWQTNFRSVIKIPFSVKFSEIYTFTTTDTRVGGWGPFFSGAILVSLLFFIYFLINSIWSKKKKEWFFFLLLIISIIITILANEESWWARYSSQVWLIPLFIYFLCVSIKNKFLKKVAITIPLIMLFNILIIASVYYKWNYRATQALDGKLISLALSKRVVDINFKEFDSNKIRLNKYNIKYREDNLKKCKRKFYLSSVWAYICEDNLIKL